TLIYRSRLRYLPITYEPIHQAQQHPILELLQLRVGSFSETQLYSHRQSQPTSSPEVRVNNMTSEAVLAAMMLIGNSGRRLSGIAESVYCQHCGVYTYISAPAEYSSLSIIENRHRRLLSLQLSRIPLLNCLPLAHNLNSVVQIAKRVALPHRDFINAEGHFGDFPLHQGFDHEAAFGIRSQDQMAHDTRIGTAGEL